MSYRGGGPSDSHWEPMRTPYIPVDVTILVSKGMLVKLRSHKRVSVGRVNAASLRERLAMM